MKAIDTLRLDMIAIRLRSLPSRAVLPCALLQAQCWRINFAYAADLPLFSMNWPNNEPVGYSIDLCTCVNRE